MSVSYLYLFELLHYRIYSQIPQERVSAQVTEESSLMNVADGGPVSIQVKIRMHVNEITGKTLTPWIKEKRNKLSRFNLQHPISDQVSTEEEEPNNGGPPSPLMLQLMEIGFSRSAVEMAFKTLGNLFYHNKHNFCSVGDECATNFYYLLLCL